MLKNKRITYNIFYNYHIIRLSFSVYNPCYTPYCSLFMLEASFFVLPFQSLYRLEPTSFATLSNIARGIATSTYLYPGQLAS